MVLQLAHQPHQGSRGGNLHPSDVSRPVTTPQPLTISWDTFQKEGHGTLESLGETSLLLGYNEPDLHMQSNLPVDTAAEAWPGLLDKCHSNGACSQATEIVSPAMAWDNKWMVDYYAKLCPGVAPQDLYNSECLHKPKYMAMYTYKPTFDAFVGEVETFMDNWPGFPILITEFSCWNFNEGEKHCHENINDFMRKALDYLDNNDRVA